MSGLGPCRLCGCTDITACVHDDGHPCAWHDEDLCTRCADYLYGNPIFAEIGAERWRQDKRLGGAEHDAGNSRQAWAQIVDRLTDEAWSAAKACDAAAFRKAMIQIAAVAAAAVESLDRKGIEVAGDHKDRIEARLQASRDAVARLGPELEGCVAELRRRGYTQTQILETIGAALNERCSELLAQDGV